MRIFCHAAEHHDGIEVRLLVDEPEKLVHGRYLMPNQAQTHGESMVIGTIHTGDLWALHEMSDEDRPDEATGRQMAYVTERIESFLAAHRLETVSVRPGSWEELDAMSASIIEPGPPYAYTVRVRKMEGAPDVKLLY